MLIDSEIKRFKFFTSLVDVFISLFFNNDMVFNLAFSFLFNFGLYAVSNFFVLCTTEKTLKFAIVFANVFSLRRLGDRQINLQI